MAEDDTIPFKPFEDVTIPPYPFPTPGDTEGLTVDNEPSKPKIPEPALVRGLIVSAVSFVGAIVGRQFGADWIDPLMDIYLVVGPIGLAWWIRRHVSPAKT